MELAQDEAQLIKCCLQDIKYPGVAFLVCLTVKEPWQYIRVEQAGFLVAELLPTAYHPRTLIALCSVFTIALHGSSSEELALLIGILPHLYHAQLNEQLPESALDALLPYLPDFTWRNWDYFESIVNAVAEWIRHFPTKVKDKDFNLSEKLMPLPEHIRRLLQNHLNS